MKYKKAFTLPELVIVLAVLAILFTMTSANLLTFYNKNTIAAAMNTLVSDIKQQQLKSMVGDTQGGASANAYSVHFEVDSYTLIPGTAFNINDPANFVVKLDDNFVFDNNMLPYQRLSFASSSGEFIDYNGTNNYITLKNLNTDETKTIKLNKYGAIVDIY